MNLSEELSQAYGLSADLGERYAKAAVFGNANDKMLFNLVRFNALIDRAERNQTEKILVRATAELMEGQKVKFSSLKKVNNTLLLDLSKAPCTEIEIEPCLSEDEVCKLIENLESFYYDC